MIYEVHVRFIDPYGMDISRTLEVPFDDSEKDDEYIITYLEDKANEWFYDIANEIFSTTWIEKNGDLYNDLEYEMNYEKYLDQCKFYHDLE